MSPARDAERTRLSAPARNRPRFAILVVLFLSQLGARYVQSTGQKQIESSAHLLRAERLDDRQAVSLGDVAKGRPLLLVFWTTWCTYCRSELDHGPRLAAGLANARIPVEVAFVNIREPRTLVEAQALPREVADRVLLDEGGDLARAFRLRGIPSHALLDRQGRPLWVGQGLQGDTLAQVTQVENGTVIDD
jgi:thiol-disulfide isomerase/thioredoxin